MSQSIFKFARWHDVEDYERLGWVRRPGILFGTHHGEWSCAMQWLCSCEPRMLRRDAA
jgi:lauroyl/myristoyl acyltransferase